MASQSPADGPRTRPMPNYIQLAKPYIFQQTIDQCLQDIGVSQLREDNIRLAGVQYIDNVRRALRLPVRTFNTAVIYYHKFRLLHSDGEYSYTDAAAASLFAACKIEDTLKKSRDILCAAYNLKLAPSEQVSPDNAIFDNPSRNTIGLERLMLEASSFDFRGRHPQHLLLKLAKHYGYSGESPIVRTAYHISLDLYRTFAPLKQVTVVLALASLELSARLHNQPFEAVGDERDYRRWRIGREEVMETLLDLLDLYTHNRSTTTTGLLAIGTTFPYDQFLQVRIPLNEEMQKRGLPRFTEYHDPLLAAAPDAPMNTRHDPNDRRRNANHRPEPDRRSNLTSPREPGNGPPPPSSSSSLRASQQQGRNGLVLNGRLRTSPLDGPGSVVTPSPSGGGSGSRDGAAASGTAGSDRDAAAAAAAASNDVPNASGGIVGVRRRVGERGREGTVRFMLDPGREEEERRVVADFVGA